jgi:hypothetical protein
MELWFRQGLWMLALLAGAVAAEAQDAPKQESEELRELRRRVEQLEEAQKKPKGQEPAEADKQSSDPAKAKSKESRFGGVLPEWVTDVKFANDLRLRYDGIWTRDDDFAPRQRGRFRLRLGAIFTLVDDLEIGVRLASSPTVGGDSGGDPISTNATFENNGSRKAVGIDWAFARWTPFKAPTFTASIAAGKLENPPNFSEMVFDVDYTPEGAAQQFSWNVTGDHVLGLYLGQYSLDELQFSSKDPFLFLEQLRLESKWGSGWSTAFGASSLTITKSESLTSTSVPDQNHGNTRDPVTFALVNRYRLLIVDGTITHTLDRFPGYEGPFPIGFSGEYIRNYGAREGDRAYALGPTIGKAGKRGNWALSYRYQVLGKDANYEELTASDNGAFYRERPVGEPASLRVPAFLNGTNTRGHVLRLFYSPADSLTISLNSWLNKAIDASPPGDNVRGLRVLLDFLWKF